MNLKKLRERKKLTQHKLAKLAGIPAYTISKHERGKDAPSIKHLKKYADALGCRISDIVDTQKCSICEQELPTNQFRGPKENKEKICNTCRKRIKKEEKKITEDIADREYTKLERLAYEIGVRIGRRKGWNDARIIQELAKDHHRRIKFIKEELESMGVFNEHRVDCPRCRAKVRLIDGFNICMMCAMPISAEDLKGLAEAGKEEEKS